MAILEEILEEEGRAKGGRMEEGRARGREMQ